MAVRVRTIRPGSNSAQVATLAGPAKAKVVSTPLEVVDTTDGPVSWLQKVKLYYKGIVAFIGTVLVLLTSPQIGPLQHLLPSNYQHYLVIAIGALTVLFTFLKENEHWFDGSALDTPPTTP